VAFDVVGFTKRTRKYGFGQLSAEGLGTCLQIFFEKKFVTTDCGEGNSIYEEKKIEYISEKTNSNQSFKADFCFEHDGKNIIFEYDGPDHYNNVFKIDRDERKKNVIEIQGYEFNCVPYFIQFTRDIAKHYFQKRYGVYSDDKYQMMLREVYKTDNECDILAPGWHTTKELPANFVVKGIDRFLKEIDTFPESIKSQLKHSLDIYVKRSNGMENLVIPLYHDGFNEFMKHTVDNKYIKHFYFVID